MSDPLATLLRKVMPRRGDLVSNTDWENAAHALREQGVIIECEWCVPRHEWPCPTIPRCDEPGCEKEATCGWPSTDGYRRTCGDHYRAALTPEDDR